MRIAIDINCSLCAKTLLRSPLWNLLRKHDVTIVVDDRVGREDFQEYAREFGPMAMQIGDFKERNPKGLWDVAVTSAGDISDQDFCRPIKEAGIPLVLIMESGDFVSQRWKNCVIPDKMCVWGPWYKDHVLKGYEEILVVTGQPRFDNYFGRVKNERLTKSMLGLPVTKPLVLFSIHPGFNDERRWILRNLAMLQDSGLGVSIAVLRRHHEKVWDLEEEFGQFRWFKGTKDTGNGYRIVDNRVTLEDAVWACSLFVSMSTTIGLEAALIGKPVIDMDFRNEQEDGTWYMQKWLEDSSYRATKDEELRHLARTVLRHPANAVSSREDQVAQIHPFRDGRSSERVMEVIESCY